MAVITSKQIVVPELIDYVEYLRSSGTQYIDTGYKPTNHTRVVCKVSGFPRTSYSQAVFGTRTSSSASDRFGFIAAEDSASYRSDFYNSNLAFASSVTFEDAFTIDKNKASTTLNDTSNVTNTSGTFTAAYSMYIFGYNTAGALTMPAASLTVYYFKIYESDVLVHDYWPCLDSEGVACLYDLVTGEYLYNAGTGEFGTPDTPITQYYWQKYSVKTTYTAKETSINATHTLELSTTIYVGVNTGCTNGYFQNVRQTMAVDYAMLSEYQTYPYYSQEKNASIVFRCYSANVDDKVVLYISHQYECIATQNKGTYISDVASTDPNAYPDDGIKDGYWYVKVVS